MIGPLLLKVTRDRALNHHSRELLFHQSPRQVTNVYEDSASSNHGYAYDHLGMVLIVMDQNGGVVARHDYLPFGEELPGGAAGRTTPGFGAADLTTQRFTGQVRDSESGQDFFNARYFMAPLGRFNSADPGNAGADLLSSQSWNGYRYVLGNPLGLTDPNIPGGQLLHSLGINHEWITTSTGRSAGMGMAQRVPQSDYPGVQTQVGDHPGQVPNSSRTFSNVDAAALNTYIKAGAPTGPWIPGVNDCNTWANGAVNSSTPHNINVVMYGVPVTIATGVVVYSDGSIQAPGGY